MVYVPFTLYVGPPVTNVPLKLPLVDTYRLFASAVSPLGVKMETPTCVVLVDGAGEIVPDTVIVEPFVMSEPAVGLVIVIV